MKNITILIGSLSQIFKLENSEENNHFVDTALNDSVNVEKLPRHKNTETSHSIVERQMNANTKKATECHLHIVTKWLETKNEFRPIEKIEPQELDLYLAQFFMYVRKHGSSDMNDLERQYEPTTLLAIHYSVFRHLKKAGHNINIKTDIRFQHSRDVLEAKMKELKQMGKGKKPNLAPPFTESEIDILYKKNLLGTSKYIEIIQKHVYNFYCLSHFVAS